MSEQQTPQVARFYTAARRIPVLIGKINGARIPGGPYTLTQLLAGGIVLWVGYKTAGIWGASLYPIIRLAALALVAGGITVLVGRIPTTRRRLIDLAQDLGDVMALPELGTYRGKRISIARPHLVQGTVLLHLEAPEAEAAVVSSTSTAAASTAGTASPADSASGVAGTEAAVKAPATVQELPAEPVSMPAPVVQPPAVEQPVPDPLPENVIPIRPRTHATGVERLLEQARRKESQ